MKYLSFLHAVLAIALAIFFLYKAYGKIVNPKLREVNESMVVQIVNDNNYAPPAGYNITMNTFTQSGFMQFINIVQILTALLIIIPRTRVLGLMMLLPMILNIFMMHLFFDNRAHEYVETGIPLDVNILLLIYYWKQLKSLFWLHRAN